MKAKVLKVLNALLMMIVSALGLGGCFPVVCKYGVPTATFDVSGSVTNEANEPLKNIRVVVKNAQGYFEKQDTSIIYAEGYCPAKYTTEDGRYDFGEGYGWPSSSITIIAEDTSGVYKTDSAQVEVQYNRSGVAKDDTWNKGSAVIEQNFRLKKN
ncbi:MAG: radical SAM-associated putative lipoprotein [Paludibacteraceae bacterium]|nr:radical SAM-associated putative lipoprotein [Paludibacteraceae bacterium]